MVSSVHLLQEFDLDAFSSAQFQDAITQRRKAEDLSAVLYPNVTWRREVLEVGGQMWTVRYSEARRNC